MKDYYKILGVSKDATEDQLKKAYRHLAMKYHPDRNRDDPKTAEEKFKEVKEAYETLSDPQKRQMVDQGIDPNDAQAGGFGGGGFGGFGGFGGADAFSDIFSSVFGDAFGGGRSAHRQSRQMRGADMQYHLEITLEEAIMGCKKDITYDNYVQCETCKGSGAAESGSLKTCPKCHGTGQIQMSRGFFSTIQECPQCSGRGKIVDKPCSKCHGDGRVRVKQTVTITVPQGIEDGQRMRLTGKGQAPLYGGVPGDLYVLVSVKEHAIFKRHESDLFCEIPISFTTAALGGKVDVPTISGTVSLTIPPETQTGKMFRIRGKGVKSVRTGSTGDIIVQVIVETPVKLNSEQKDLLKRFEESLNGGSQSVHSGVKSEDGKAQSSRKNSKDSGDEHSPKQSRFMDLIHKFFDDIKNKGKKE